jgi:hypothetical protein
MKTLSLLFWICPLPLATQEKADSAAYRVEGKNGA